MIFAFVLNLLPGLMVLGVVTPVVGPAIDHHYVDRSPAHAHVFTGDESHEHDHTLANHDHSDQSLEHSGDGTSIVSTSISSGFGLSSLNCATLEVHLPKFEGNTVVVYTEEVLAPDGDVIAPLDRPPRRVS
ncbi:MAG: hypothetical protein CL731_07260 [Chloroflexi bacterium]|nr:hypothetical protein [Chloroflexota bacterium]